MEKLEWRDVRLDGPEPFLNVRASTTKNHRPAPISIDAELAEELRKIRPVNADPKGRVFAGVLPRIERFRLDLKAAGIESVNGAGDRVDFHALRMTFQMFLTLGGASPRVAMELMRHSDMKLTMKTYTDAGKLPTRAVIESLPSLLSAEGTKNGPPQLPPGLVPNGHSVAQSVTPSLESNESGTLINKGSGHDLSHHVISRHTTEEWCAVQGLNLRLPACEAGALPLS